jgi:hypothetical protein
VPAQIVSALVLLSSSQSTLVLANRRIQSAARVSCAGSAATRVGGAVERVTQVTSAGRSSGKRSAKSYRLRARRIAA